MAFHFLTSLFSTSALWFWEAVEIWGAIIVTAGVVGEYVANFTKIPKGRAHKTRLEKRSTLTLIFGLAVELVGLVLTMTISNTEVAGLQKETAALQHANLELKAKMRPRRITPEQEKNFISLCASLPKMPIKVIVGV